ncbi:hypothetical protein [Candidatus Pelagibacter sp. HIMB1782]|uniref:hypothetical protein n=1 Tax=Candidatus Pelagibacter sp. HIMB1782 TaxID=3413375 RepID=UPI003F87F73E
MKLFIQIFLLLFLINFNAISGESGDLPGQEENKPEDIFDKKTEEQEGLDVSSLTELLKPKNTDVLLPKNRLDQIFNQLFLAELNKDQLKIIGECEKSLVDGNCFVVEPKILSNHFNNYYFYTNSQNQVYSIIVFNNEKQGDLNNCKDKISLWKDYFNSFDLTEKEPNDNSLNFVLTDAPQKNSLEIFASCYSEQFRDIKSSFSIKFFKNV